MLGRYVCTDAGVFLVVCECLKGKEGLWSLGIAAVSCTTIRPISRLIQSHIPAYLSYFTVQSSHSLHIQDLLFTIYTFILYCKLQQDYTTLTFRICYTIILSTRTICIAHKHTHACTHQISPLRIRFIYTVTLFHADPVQELTVFRLIPAESYTSWCLFTLLLNA